MLDERQTCLYEIARALVQYRTNNQRGRRHSITHADVRIAVQDGYRIMPEIDHIARDEVTMELANNFNLGPPG